MVQVNAIPAFNDNYIWCMQSPDNQAVVVDPGDAAPVLAYLQQQQLTLQAILVTHHHWDHTNGISELLARFAYIEVYGPANSPYKGITHPLCHQDELTVLGVPFTIAHTAGHTLDHICYLNPDFCFSGDTLFSGGCGRLFEGTAEQMWQSLQHLLALPDTCKLYCTHEYTQANLAFARAVEPDNRALQDYSTHVDTLRQQQRITLPSTIGLEKKINPFLRANIIECSQLLCEYRPQNNEPAAIFAGLRAWKDNF